MAECTGWCGHSAGTKDQEQGEHGWWAGEAEEFVPLPLRKEPVIPCDCGGDCGAGFWWGEGLEDRRDDEGGRSEAEPK